MALPGRVLITTKVPELAFLTIFALSATKRQGHPEVVAFLGNVFVTTYESDSTKKFASRNFNESNLT